MTDEQLAPLASQKDKETIKPQPKVILVDVSNTLVFKLRPKEGDRSKLNPLYKQLKAEAGSDFDFLKHFAINKRLLRLLQSLKQQGDIALCIFTTDEIQNDPEVTKLTGPIFDQTFVANELKHTLGITGKEDPRVYTHIAETLGVAPEEIVFIDDKSTNRAAAEQANLQTIPFDRIGQVETNLSSIFSQP